VYLGDFLVFAVIWIILFEVTPQSAWTQANQPRFWPVVIMLIGLAWFAGFRVSHAVAAIPSLLLFSVSSMIRSDTDISPLLEVADEDRNHVRQRLEEVLRTEREAAVRHPSLYRFFAYRMGFSEAAKDTAVQPRCRGFPFQLLYARGLRFSFEEDRFDRYDSQWLDDYLAYLYYRMHGQLSKFVRALGQLIHYFVTGVP
jgi:hypothetical protein